jgi:hypothetical protein
VADLVRAGRPVKVVVKEWSRSTTHEVTRVSIVDGWLVLDLADGNVLAWPDHIVRGEVRIVLPAAEEAE